MKFRAALRKNRPVTDTLGAPPDADCPKIQDIRHFAAESEFGKHCNTWPVSEK